MNRCKRDKKTDNNRRKIYKKSLKHKRNFGTYGDRGKTEKKRRKGKKVENKKKRKDLDAGTESEMQIE